MDGLFNRQNDRVYAACRQEADAHEGIRPTAKFTKRIMVWLGASINGLTAPIIFESGETLPHKNYIEVVLQQIELKLHSILTSLFF